MTYSVWRHFQPVTVAKPESYITYCAILTARVLVSTCVLCTVALDCGLCTLYCFDEYCVYSSNTSPEQ